MATKPEMAADGNAWRRANRDKARDWEKKNRGKNGQKIAAKMKRWRSKSAAKIRAYKKAYNRKNLMAVRASAKNNKLMNSYGITLTQFDAMLKKQNCACAICLKPFGEGRKKGPCVDHCHKSGEVRGLLCTRCNTLLGQADDSILVLNRAIQYVLHWEALHNSATNPQKSLWDRINNEGDASPCQILQ